MTAPRDGRRNRTARRLLVASALVAAACTALLLGDHALAVARVSGDKARVEALEERVKTDAAVAKELLAEQERQTAASLARDARSRVLAWVLFVAGCGFAASGRWWAALRSASPPALETLLAARSPARASATTRPRAGDGTVETEVDLGWVDERIAEFGHGREAAVPILQALQRRFRYLPDEALARVCERTEITPAEIAGTSSFYAQFRHSPVGRHVVRVCHGTACHVAGAERIGQELRRHFAIPAGADTDPLHRVTLDSVACLGCCSLAPVIMIGDETAGRLTPASAREMLDAEVSR